MALPATGVWQVQATGSDSQCAGGFNAARGGTDYSQSNTAIATGTVTSSSTTVTATTGIFTAAMVGNYVSDGTTIKEITAYTSATVVTVDSAPSWAAATVYVGGALASPGFCQGKRVSGDTAWWKGSFAITTATFNVSGGCINFNTTGSQGAWCRTYGYTTTRGDGGKAVLTLGAGLTASMMQTNNANSYNEIRNVWLVGNATTQNFVYQPVALAHAGRSNRVTNFKASGFTGAASYGIVGVSLNATLENFEISGGNTGATGALNVALGIVERGWVHGNAGRGVDIGGLCTVNRVASTDHTGANGIGFVNEGAIEVLLTDCVADNNAQSNYKLVGGAPTLVCRRCVSTRAGGYDFDNLSAPDAISLDGCATYGAASGQYPATPATLLNHKILTAMPYAGAGDYGLNPAAGAGASCKGIAYTTPGGTSVSYEDIGAVQHRDAGGIIRVGMGGGIGG